MSKYGPEKAQYLDAFHAWLFSFYFHVYIFGCLRLTKWLQYIFSVFLKFGAYYITGQWGEFIKQCYLMHLCTFVFHHKICVFIIFISFFDEVSNFRNRILTNQKWEYVIPAVSGTACIVLIAINVGDPTRQSLNFEIYLCNYCCLCLSVLCRNLLLVSWPRYLLWDDCKKFIKM